MAAKQAALKKQEENRKMKARDVMTSPVKTAGPRDTIRTAIETMLAAHVSGLPVVDGEGRLVGVLSQGDLLRRVELGTEKQRSRWLEFLVGPGRSASDYVQTHGRYIEEVMTADPIVVEADTPLEEVVGIMERRRIKRVPVVRDGKLIGIITRSDFLASLLAAEKATAVATGNDTAIRTAILEELQKKAWVPSASIRIAVVDGTVTLAGTILDERERDALRVAAENVPGVKAVHDELLWVDPYLGAYLGPPGIIE
jgi:CBS domain-containing protein